MKQTKKTKPSAKTQEEALAIARGTQRPGQTKEQTKLIAQGIQKGIEQYKKQQSAKARELDKKLKKTRQQSAAQETAVEEDESVTTIYKQHWLPWLLLVLSWLAIAVYVLLYL